MLDRDYVVLPILQLMLYTLIDDLMDIKLGTDLSRELVFACVIVVYQSDHRSSTSDTLQIHSRYIPDTLQIHSRYTPDTLQIHSRYTLDAKTVEAVLLFPYFYQLYTN